MKNTETKKQLMKATVELLSSNETPEEITARQIAAESKVNLALINYYYGSKDALINEAIGQILQEAADNWQSQIDETKPPKEKLKQMLVNLSNMAVKYYHYTKITLKYEILENEITVPYYILPMIKAYYGKMKSETELKLIAFQLISTLQVIFIKSGPFTKYIGEDIWDEAIRERIIKNQVDLLLQGGNEGGNHEQ